VQLKTGLLAAFPLVGQLVPFYRVIALGVDQFKMYSSLQACAAIIVVLLLSNAPWAEAQNFSDQYTIYASVIYARTGERTAAFKLPAETWRLTPYGAQQMVDLVCAHKAELSRSIDFSRDHSFARDT
jgi:hypothetical protein